MSENAPLQQPPRKAEVLADMPKEGIGLFQRAEERLSQLGAGQSAEETPFEQRVLRDLERQTRKFLRRDFTNSVLDRLNNLSDAVIVPLNSFFSPVSKPFDDHIVTPIVKAARSLLGLTKG